MDPYKLLKIVPNPDGTLTRNPTFPSTPPSLTDPTVLSKDVHLGPTFLRLYLPTPTPPTPLPVFLAFHGGGFVLFSAASSVFHSSCSRLAASLPALVLSLDYRLAPEHPLPSAYDDAIQSLLWLRTSSDPWISHADLTRVFLFGSSSGGNIAFHVGLRCLDLDLNPIRIRGLILNQPFFGGEERTESELRMEKDRIVPLVVGDLMWKLALPVGSDRDHEYCNPVKRLKRVIGLPRCLVRGYVGDPLIDRQREFATWLEGKAEEVVKKVDLEGFHGIDLFDEEKHDEMVNEIKEFVCGKVNVGNAKY